MCSAVARASRPEEAAEASLDRVNLVLLRLERGIAVTMSVHVYAERDCQRPQLYCGECGELAGFDPDEPFADQVRGFRRDHPCAGTQDPNS